ncbi:MAG: SEC-C domain-containing protein [Eubacteriaceae bacterium]|nr:SEC-C domain-containing protein [Eubacteriaceae bacterium]
MSLYEEWRKTIEDSTGSEEEYKKFWNDYCDQEQEVYKKILANNQKEIKGKVSDLAAEYNLEVQYFMGFLDGINESIETPNELEKIGENDEVHLVIDFEKLYYNMLAVPADWLYTLPEWDKILTVEKRKEIAKNYNRSKIVVNENKVGRNDPCPCGSGKKYKKCCGKAQ